MNPINGKLHLLDCRYCINEFTSQHKEPCKSCGYGSKQILKPEFIKGKTD